MSDVYTELASHLDELPGGYPATDSGVELRILRRLFDEDEARLAVHLTLMAMPPRLIARRAGLEVEKVAALLKEMARKGLIYRVYKRGEARYAASQFVIGIWEYHVNDLDPDLIEDVNAYLPHVFRAEYWKEAPQLRTIPVGESVEVDREILPHEVAAELVQEHTRIVVAPCICRREHQMLDRGCQKSLETCLIFGSAADYYLENGLGRSIDVAEALQILEIAKQEGLVLQPSNAQRISNICCCCGCCCQVLKAFKRHPQPATLVSTPYFVSVIEEECIACEDCLARCQMEALSLLESWVVVDLNRCIGCGLCVVTCPTECLILERKPLEQLQQIPETLGHAYLNLARARGKTKAFDMPRMRPESP